MQNKIMYTFFETNAEALADKTLIPFSTYAGSGLSGFDKKLARSCPNSTVGKGVGISGKDAQNNQIRPEKKLTTGYLNWDISLDQIYKQECYKVKLIHSQHSFSVKCSETP
jgi:hypothetical protein